MKTNLNSEEQKLTMISIIFTIVVFLYYFLTFIIFGENSVLAIFDYLNVSVPQYKMFHDEKLFFKFDVPTKCFEGMSTLYYMNINYSFQFLLYSFLNTFWAIILIRCLAILFGFFSMYLLLRKCFFCPVFISVLISLCFTISIPPNACDACIAYNTIPFIAYAFYYFSFKCRKIFSMKSIFLLFFPLFSNFFLFGLYICLFWFLGLVFQIIKNKKINYNLLVGFISLCIGYILVDLKMFYVVFILKTTLNRDIPYFNLQSIASFSFNENLENIFIRFNTYWNYEYLCSEILTKLIFPFAVIVVLVCMYFRKHNKKQSNNLLTTDKKLNVVILIMVFHLFIVFIISLYTMFYIAISDYLPTITRFNITRVVYFARVYWFVVLALCLEKIYIRKPIYLEIQDGITEKLEIKIKSFLFLIIILFFILAQVLFILYKSDIYNTWNNYKRMILRENKIHVTYNEFYGEKLFSEIKQSISYSNEKVCAYGFHPAVLMYNGFSCIDGYNNSYPLSYMEKFKELINPILSDNYAAVNYFNYWGGTMYVYDSPPGMMYGPLLHMYRNFEPILQVDMDVLRRNFGIKYILSAYQLENAREVGISLKGIFTQKDSIYTIYLYDVN